MEIGGSSPYTKDSGTKMTNTYSVTEGDFRFKAILNVSCHLEYFDKTHKKIGEVLKNHIGACWQFEAKSTSSIDVTQYRKIEDPSLCFFEEDSHQKRGYRVLVQLSSTAQLHLKSISQNDSFKESVEDVRLNLDEVISDKNDQIDLFKLRAKQSLGIISYPSLVQKSWPLSDFVSEFKTYPVMDADLGVEEDSGSESDCEVHDSDSDMEITE